MLSNDKVEITLIEGGRVNTIRDDPFYTSLKMQMKKINNINLHKMHPTFDNLFHFEFIASPITLSI